MPRHHHEHHARAALVERRADATAEYADALAAHQWKRAERAARRAAALDAAARRIGGRV